MKKGYALTGIILVLVVVLVIILWPKRSDAPLAGNNAEPQPVLNLEDGKIYSIVAPQVQADHLIEITTGGFWPQELRVKSGDSVIWTNRDQKPHQIAADPANPYPEQGDCGSKLNSCSPIKLGESFRVTFGVAGTWKYSDKLNPKFPGGTIIVQ